MQKSTTAAVNQDLLDSYFKLATVTLLALAIYAVLITPAMATTPMGTVLCNIVGMFTGNLGRGLSTLAVLVVGVGATLGKVSWGLAITVAVGIAVIMNATTVAGAVGGFSGC
ncbi:MAG: TrbC/VirB2 family protein [Alphaproteobacteria bacterium]